MKTEVVLTVAESKRLIARGVAALDLVRARQREGIIVVAKGSTNAYVYEELTGLAIDKRAYVTGCTLPAGRGHHSEGQQLRDLVLVNGKPDPSLDRHSAPARMTPGDVYIKGANALNYAKSVAGITIANPASGGTIGAAIGAIISKKIDLLIPIGLEKETPLDILTLSTRANVQDDFAGKVCGLWPITGRIYTEIEALRTLSGVQVFPVGSGGICGAEGGVRLLLEGSNDDIRRATEVIAAVQGEPPF